MFWFPVAYNKYAHLVLECLSVIFWLSTFSALAVVATYSWGVACAYTGYCPRSKYSGSSSSVDYSSYANATKAAAALGAIEWALFIGTLISFGV
jgi:hypothetical protein